MKWQVNILALIAAVFGLVAVFFDWIYGGYSPNLNLIDSLGYSFHSDLFAGCVLSFVGVLTCFLSPIGGFFEVIGAVMFLNAYWEIIESYRFNPVGAYIAAVSGVVALVSLARPIVIGEHADKKPGITRRFLVFIPLQRLTRKKSV